MSKNDIPIMERLELFARRGQYDKLEEIVNDKRAASDVRRTARSLLEKHGMTQRPSDGELQASSFRPPATNGRRGSLGVRDQQASEQLPGRMKIGQNRAR